MFACLRSLAVSHISILLLFQLTPTLCALSAVEPRVARRSLSSSQKGVPSKPKTNCHPPPAGNYYGSSSNIFDVLSFGAKGDGSTDDTEAFQAAWQQACRVESAILEVPAYFTFLVRPIVFSGPCANFIAFQVDGTIIAPQSPRAWGANQALLQWINFSKLQNLALQGDGVIDGRGDCWWSFPCKMKDSKGRRISRLCDSPTAVRFYGSHNVTVKDLKIMNSPQTHLKFDNCVGVQVNNISISSPATSPNTDGIHLQNSQNVVIKSSIIEDGDDCISIQTGTSNLEIHDVHCGTGHGISIGGLGASNSKACVKNISVHDVTIQDSQNGLRIKTWQGGSGRVNGVAFTNINVMNIGNPIIIDQYYCDARTCKNQTAAVEISDVSYSDIKGTYTHGNSIHFACSETVPCKDINVAKIQLVPEQSGFVDCPFCYNAYGPLNMPSTPSVTCLRKGSATQRRQQSVGTPAGSC